VDAGLAAAVPQAVNGNNQIAFSRSVELVKVARPLSKNSSRYEELAATVYGNGHVAYGGGRGIFVPVCAACTAATEVLPETRRV
tara:strand:- start:358 stop:609 length:252 start_codon:yes stop_codon:yes gene_type:complete